VAVTICSMLVTIVGSIVKDVTAASQQTAADLRQRELQTELRLSNASFNRFKITLSFDVDPVPWREKAFLSEASKEYFLIEWTGENVPRSEWMFHKDRQSAAGFERHREVLFVERRPDRIRKFFEQNESPVREFLPRELEFLGGLSSLDGIQDPQFIIFDYHEDRDALGNAPRFGVEHETLWVELRRKLSYQDVLGSRIAMSYGLVPEHIAWSAPDLFIPPRIEQVLRGQPRPNFLADLREVRVAFDGKEIAVLYSRDKDLHDVAFASAPYVDLHQFAVMSKTLTREMFLRTFASE
jgi:hypothetical protein